VRHFHWERLANLSNVWRDNMKFPGFDTKCEMTSKFLQVI
jgi:hypothetical protein